MRTFMYLILGGILMSCTTLKSNKVDILTSTDLVGVWVQTGEVPAGREVCAGAIKVINPDHTFYLIWNTQGNNFESLDGRTTNKPFIGLQGTYELGKEDGEFRNYTEHIVKSTLHPTINRTNSELKYKMIDKNTLLLMYQLKETGSVGKEIWKRITPLK